MPLPEGERTYEPFDVEQFRPDLKREKGSEPSAGVQLLDADGKPLPSFDMRHADDLEGLVFLGALQAKFSWVGHDFIIRTLTQDEIMTSALVIKPFMGSLGEPKAYSTAIAAMCIVSVDGRELPIPIEQRPGPNGLEMAWAQVRFDYVKRNWFASTVDKVYSEFLDLEAVVGEVIQAMGELYGPTESTPGSNASSDGPNDEDSSLVTD